MNIIDKIDKYLNEKKTTTQINADLIVKQEWKSSGASKTWDTQMLQKALIKVVNQPTVKLKNKTLKITQGLIEAIWTAFEVYL